MSALLTDLYQLTMLQAYVDEGMTQPAVFELFVRKLPAQRNFLVAAGLEQVLQFLETLSFSDAEIAWLREQGGFSEALLDHLKTMRFEGDVDAMPEGTVFFAEEPFIRITAPLPQAQLVESRLLNLAHFQTLIASMPAAISMNTGSSGCWPMPRPSTASAWARRWTRPATRPRSMRSTSSSPTRAFLGASDPRGRPPGQASSK